MRIINGFSLDIRFFHKEFFWVLNYLEIDGVTMKSRDGSDIVPNDVIVITAQEAYTIRLKCCSLEGLTEMMEKYRGKNLRILN